MQMWNKHALHGNEQHILSVCVFGPIAFSVRFVFPCGFVRCRSCPATANAAAWCGSSNHVNWVLGRSLALHWKLHVTRMLILMWFLPVLGIFGHRAPEPLATGKAKRKPQDGESYVQKVPPFVTTNDREKHIVPLWKDCLVGIVEASSSCFVCFESWIRKVFRKLFAGLGKHQQADFDSRLFYNIAWT